MRRKIIVMFFSLFFFVLVPAGATDRGALFKVASGGHTMYLFGTMHVGLPEYFPLEPRILAALNSASVLALEIDMEQAQGLAAAMEKHGKLAPGSDLFAKLSAQERPRLERALANVNIPAPAVSSFRPWFVASLLSLAEFGKLGYDPMLSVDTWLAKQAHNHKVRVVELESVDAQLDLFNRLSEKEEVAYLMETVDMMESGRQQRDMRQIVEAWASADKAAFEEIAARSEADTSLSGRFVQKVLIDERNVTLAARLEKLLASENHSVAAIGLLHLVGTASVPALLKAQGVKVERVY
jgi:uncharacterized protein YbaP (TraB family)